MTGTMVLPQTGAIEATMIPMQRNQTTAAPSQQHLSVFGEQQGHTAI
jgi:hypothetical protein